MCTNYSLAEFMCSQYCRNTNLSSDCNEDIGVNNKQPNNANIHRNVITVHEMKDKYRSEKNLKSVHYSA